MVKDQEGPPGRLVIYRDFPTLPERVEQVIRHELFTICRVSRKPGEGNTFVREIDKVRVVETKSLCQLDFMDHRLHLPRRKLLLLMKQCNVRDWVR